MAATYKSRSLVLAALCAALTAVVAPWSIAIGPISLTLSLFSVYLSGCILPPQWALAAQAVYIALGCIGLPVFSGYRAGPQVLLGPTGGYLLAYPAMALLVAMVCRNTRAFLPRLGGVAVATAVCYTFGTAWFMIQTGSSLTVSLGLCVIPFVLPDLAKGICALLLARLIEKRVRL